MPIDLNEPLDWESATGDARVMLEDLQGNILKGHGRHHTANLFLNFSGEKTKVARSLNSIGRQLPSALDQLRDAAAFSKTDMSAGRFLAFFISKKGYAWLGAPAPSSSPNPPHSSDATLVSMLDRAAELDDPKLAELDAHFRQDRPEKIIHALLLIGDDGPEDVEAEASRWTWLLAQDGISVVGAEFGRAYFNAANQGLENFGYVDGRSQPLLLVQDVADEGEKSGVDGSTDPASWNWSPIFPLGQFVVSDPGGATPHSFGSYFVFRKLEQNVEGFKNAESEAEDGLDGPASLASALGLKAPGMSQAERERAGAMIVGRYEDGTPFVASHAPPGGSAPAGGPVANNFNFETDAGGSLCPFRAHIRKTNPARGRLPR
jgi:deferrochelatase/peroxidase EfeB